MNDPAVQRLLDRMQGLWRELTDAKLTAYADWMGRCPASEREFGAALDDLAEERDHIPTVKMIRDKLQELGALSEPPSGVGDPRMIVRHVASLTDHGHGSVRDVAFLLGRDYRDRLQRERDQHQVFLEEAVAVGIEESVNWYRDRLAAYDELLIAAGHSA